MEDQLIGSSECTSARIVTVIQSAATSSRVRDSWTDLARSLDVTVDTITALRRQMLFGTKNHWNALYEVLEDWSKRNPKRVTIGDLVKKMQECEWNEIAGKGQDKIARVQSGFFIHVVVGKCRATKIYNCNRCLDITEPPACPESGRRWCCWLPD